MEADSESESPPSGIDLSEEFITIADDISIDIEDIEDMNDIQSRNKRKKKSKRLKNNKYASVEDDQSDEDERYLEQHYRADQVFGMQSLAEDKEEDRFSPNVKKSNIGTSEEDSDALSELSAEQSH
eukprot:291851_1